MTQTLLLSNSYEPIRTISWQRAVTLLFLNKIEILSSYDGFVRSTTLVIKVPAVARLLSAFKRNKKIVRFSRINIFGRDEYRCQYCGERSSLKDLTFDHVIPRSQGGKTEWTNIVSACSGSNGCNAKKGGRTPEQAGMKLLKKPVRPKWTPALHINFGPSTPESWRSFLYWTDELKE